MNMYEETRMFVDDWNATYSIKDFDEREIARDDLREGYNAKFGFTKNDLRLLRMLAESIHRGNDTFVISLTGASLTAESYSDFFEEHGIDEFAYINDSTAALHDIITFMHLGWEVSGHTLVAAAYGDKHEAIVLKR